MAKVATQDAVDRAADELLKECGYDIDKVIPNRVAKGIGWGKSNDLIKEKLQNWKERRIAEGVPYIAKAPPELDAGLEVVFESFRRLTKGLVGKYRAGDAEGHEQEIDKWSDRYDSLEAEFKELRNKLNCAEERCRSLSEENERFASTIALTKSELNKAEAKLQVVQDQYDKLLSALGHASRLAADEAPMPPDDVSPQSGQANHSDGKSSQKRGRGRPRKVRPEPSSAPSAAPASDDLLAGTPWEKGHSGGET